MSDKDEMLQRIDNELTCTGFAVSSTMRANGRDSFISLSFSDKHIPPRELALWIMRAEQKLSRLSLTDAIAKGIISKEQHKRMMDTQEHQYQVILDALLAKLET